MHRCPPHRLNPRSQVEGLSRDLDDLRAATELKLLTAAARAAALAGDAAAQARARRAGLLAKAEVRHAGGKGLEVWGQQVARQRLACQAHSQSGAAPHADYRHAACPAAQVAAHIWPCHAARGML